MADEYRWLSPEQHEQAFPGHGDGTRCVHAGLPEPTPGAPFLPGPVLAAPYHLDPWQGPEASPNGYGRPDNPTRRLLEAAIGELEGGDCRVFASGQAAITGLLLAVLRAGNTVVLPADGYFPVRAFATDTLAGNDVRVLFAPTAGPYPPFDGVRLVLVETPANPGLDVVDLPALAERVHAAGALLAVDNTTATPLGQRPLDLGADVVVASGTKALTGHSDLLLGYLATRSPDLLSTLTAWRTATGAVPGAFDAWLAHRSLATLDLRLARQTANAEALARLLAGRADVTGLRWPGLPDDPSYPVAARQLRRIPGVLSFDLGSAERVARFLDAARLVAAATSFGGLHTTADRRAQWGDDTAPGFVRLSCGVEDTADLVADVTAALDAAA
ncbi:cystathionine gamma-lyase [Micromonospora sp. DT48]|uniref:cystathionine gamma-lyase n=1 Tax=unclassified Micromonospora TaxID=2617518 RepID=UPI0012BCFC33|nr:cystathionine gamma-lyase [Micromonospora sp. CP22]MTK01958.1 cystathionine gamma-lyase [Micromonospora sp. CP22]